MPFTFEDGDHYVVLLKQVGDQWYLTDEGHTFMHLSYLVPQFDQGNRRGIIDKVLASLRVESRDGELRLPVEPESAGDSFFTFIQAITRISDVTFLSRERVRSTFAEDFQQVVQKAASGRTVTPSYSHPQHDPEKLYPVDIRVDGSNLGQVLLFGIGNDEQCQRATITLYRWQQWGERFGSVGIFRDQTEINRHALARFTDIAGRQFSTLETARDMLTTTLADLLPA